MRKETDNQGLTVTPCPACTICSSTSILLAWVMEEWDFIDERELQGWKGTCICMTCQHFCYGVDQHCHTLLGCNARQQQLQQGDHLKKKCKLWAPTWQKEFGWAPEAG